MPSDSVLAKIDSSAKLLIVCFTLAVISLAFNMGSSVIVLPGPYDNERFIEMAREISLGHWLGEYDFLTLIRRPGYPVFLALNSLAGTRLPLVQHLLFLLGFAFLLIALLQNQIRRERCVLIFAGCLLNPMTLLLPKVVTAETFAAPLLVLVFSSCLGIYACYNNSRLRLGSWILLLCLSLAIYGVVRDEAIWVLSIPVALTALLVVRWGKEFLGARSLLALALPVICLFSLSNLVASINYHHYEVKAVNDLSESNFKAALKSLTRINPQAHRRYVPVTAEALTMAYAVSPHFAELETALTRQLNGGPWLGFGCDYMGICDQLIGGWTVWAIREAASQAGHHSSGKTATEFYANVAEEINQACDSNQLPCTTNLTGNALAPPLKLEYLPAIALSTITWMKNILIFDSMLEAIDGAVSIVPSAQLNEKYAVVTHAVENDYTQTSQLLSKPYLTLFVLLQVAGSLAIAVLSLVGVKNLIRDPAPFPAKMKKLTHVYCVTWLACVVLLVRSGLVAYVDVMSFNAQIRYMLILYPFVVLLIGLHIPLPGLSGINKLKSKQS